MMAQSLTNRFNSLILLGLVCLLLGEAGSQPTLAARPAPQSADFPLCAQPPLAPSAADMITADESEYRYRVYLPLIIKSSVPPLPDCTVYCGLIPEHDPYQPPDYQTYFADEFDCGQLLDYWVVQGQMSAASYAPPTGGQVEVSQGTMKVSVPDEDVSFPYIYVVDDLATTYDVAHSTESDNWAPRVDWVPNTGNFRLAMRVRFNVEELGEHRISIYADGHRPAYAGPLFYVGSDYNDQEESWRGLIVGSDRGNDFVDLGDVGYNDPYTDWVVVTVDFDYSADSFTLAVDGIPAISKPLSAFKGYPNAAIRPDTLYVGSLALLEHPTGWTDLELDWIRVYAPETAPVATYGLQEAMFEFTPVATDTPAIYSTVLPTGPFRNTPHWDEDFDQPGLYQLLPDYWQLIQNPDPNNAWTELDDGQAKLLNNGSAIGVPVWAVFDDMLPITILSDQTGERESPEDYLRRRGGSPLWPVSDELGAASQFSRFDWRPNEGNVRFAWRGLQTANGYGVEISNGGHFPYFTGAMFYTLQDTTSNNGQGQFIFPACQEQYFWRLHQLPGYSVPHNDWTVITADYINGTVHLYVDGQKVGWWPESDCSLNWYLKGENATSPDVFFFGNPATASNAAGGWSELFIDWVATFAGLPRNPPL